jgi:hypothetical protein
MTTFKLVIGENTAILAKICAAFSAIFISAIGYIVTIVLIKILISCKKPQSSDKEIIARWIGNNRKEG